MKFEIYRTSGKRCDHPDLKNERPALLYPEEFRYDVEIRDVKHLCSLLKDFENCIVIRIRPGRILEIYDDYHD